MSMFNKNNDISSNYDSEGLGNGKPIKIMKYLLFIVPSIIVVVIVAIIFFKPDTSKLSAINADSNYDLFKSEESSIYVEFVGVKNAKKVKYDLSVSDNSVVEIKNDTISNDKLKLILNPKAVGKTSLSITATSKSEVVTKDVDLVVCKRITSKDLPSKEIYMKPDAINDLSISAGEIPECEANVKVESTDENVIKVDNGSIKSVKDGKASVNIVQGKSKVKLDITVSNTIVLANKIVLNNGKNVFEVVEGSTLPIPYKIEPEEANNKQLNWKSSDESVVQVDQNGKVTGLKAGMSTITASSSDGSNIKASILVRVKSKSTGGTQDDIALETDHIDFYKGDTSQIEYSIKDGSFKYDTIIFESSDPKVATVDKNGLITAISPGNADISVIAKYGEYEMARADIKVTVQKKVDGINLKEKNVSLYVNQTKKVEFELFPPDIEYTSLTFESSDDNVVEVDDKGTLKAVGIGTANVNVIIINKNNTPVTASLKVTVASKPTSIKINGSSISMYKGDSTKVSYSVQPSNSSYKSISFKTSNSNVVAVDNSGIIKGIGAGTANVIVRVTNNDNTYIEEQIKVIVKERINTRSITINGSYKLDYDESAKISYSLSPSNAEVKSIKFVSSNANMLNVTNDGIVTLKGAGKYQATVIVTNFDNSTVQAVANIEFAPSIVVNQLKSSAVTSNSATVSAYISNSNNKKISEVGVYIWENGTSQPSSPTYKKAENYSNKTLTVDTKSISKNLTAGKVYKYMFYAKANNRQYNSSQGSFTTLSIQSLSFSRAYAAVQVGATYKLPIVITPNNAAVKPAYTSANTSIATVDGNGTITGKATGATTVTAKYGNLSATIKVRVVGQVSKNKPATFYDISEYNTITSWSKMKSKGINYLILRMGITSTFNGKDTRVDDSFDDYVKNARANNIEIGVYYYSKATSTANVQNEANFVLKTLNKYSNGTFALPVFIDYEEYSQPKNQTGANLITSFCDVIEKGGYYCGAYMSYSIFNDYSLGNSVKARWVPDWTCSGRYAASVKNLGMWQFAADTSESCLRPTVYGINFADSNYMYLDFASTIINSGLNKFK